MPALPHEQAPPRRTKYMWGACDAEGRIIISEQYDCWDTCYDDYCTRMGQIRNSGVDLSEFQWRQVATAEDMVDCLRRHYGL